MSRGRERIHSFEHGVLGLALIGMIGLIALKAVTGGNRAEQTEKKKQG